MTTVTETDVDLEDWLDDVPQCELLRDRGGSEKEPCGNEAVWRIYARKPDCGHDTLESVLACDECLQNALDGKRPLNCGACRMWVYIDRVERL